SILKPGKVVRSPAGVAGRFSGGFFWAGTWPEWSPRVNKTEARIQGRYMSVPSIGGTAASRAGQVGRRAADQFSLLVRRSWGKFVTCPNPEASCKPPPRPEGIQPLETGPRWDTLSAGSSQPREHLHPLNPLTPVPWRLTDERTSCLVPPRLPARHPGL